jgi:hypothetical protein
MQKQSSLKNHPNVIAGFKHERNDFHNTVLSGSVAEAKDSQYCHHKTDSHNLVECKTFFYLTLDQKTEFIKKTKLCFQRLLPYHIASKCKAKVKCSKCNSDRHLSLLHKDRMKKSEEQRPKADSISWNAIFKGATLLPINIQNAAVLIVDFINLFLYQMLHW